MLREENYLADVVEQYNAYSGQRKDLFGIFDILAVDTVVTLGVQVCGADFSSHVKKMTEEKREMLLQWLGNPLRMALLIGWRKVKAKKGGKQMVYRPRIMHFTVDEFGVISMQEFKNGETIKMVLYGGSETRAERSGQQTDGEAEQ
jgi:hypothetical protein